jgi:molybdopterin-guanine dinucleotide biosynthesis protein A
MSSPSQQLLAGLVIAGGSSSRMGRDKSALLLEGETWWSRQARTLRASGANPVFLSRRPGQDLPGTVPCIQDLYTDIGPLAGLQAALARPARPLIAVLAVDMPLVDSTWFAGLLAHCDASTGAIHAHDGFLEPLAAIYPACALPLVQAQIDASQHSLQALARRLIAQGLLHPLPLPLPLQGQERSFNTPSSLASLGHRHSPGR